jgi:hypothetical protein
MKIYKHTTESFIKKAKEIHGDKYDYSLVEYKNNKTLVKIKCDTHGIFLQEPRNHLYGHSCPLCSHVTPIKMRNTTTQFIEKAKEIHGDKYDYSLVDYIKSNMKVDILCSIHGHFLQEANSHLSGFGCPRCVGRLKTNEKFIEQSINVHGDKYDYSLIDYINSSSKIKIVCNKHGIFEQKPNSHLLGFGCPMCAGKNKNTDIFIEESVNIHGDKYDYSKVNYIGSRLKVQIICKEHGIFEQTPTNHLSGKGCPICKESSGENKIRIILEKNNINYIRNKKFDDCKNKKILPFDFYLPDYNICIEFDGIQHYKPIKYFGGVKRLKYQIFCDNIKSKYCLKNNIELIRIKYDQDIISSLNFIFKD